MASRFDEHDGSFVAATEIGEDQLRRALSTLSITDTELDAIVAKIGSRTYAMLLYGSRARSDFIETSDFDLLRLTNGSGSPTFKSGRVSVSSYTRIQLEGATRTLFGTHLARDGQILVDPYGYLKELVEKIEPADPHTLLDRVRRYSEILNQNEAEVYRHHPGLTRLARYLLRTAIYAQSMIDGPVCFSVRELADRFGEPRLATLLASDPEIVGESSVEKFDELVSRLVDVVGPLPQRRFSSLDALAVAMWNRDRNLAALAIRAADEDGESLDYSDLPKVLL